MGMWVENFRHGSGVLVTLDGMYFEGTFVQNKLTVSPLFFFFLVAPKLHVTKYIWN